MAKFTKAVNIWALTPDQTKALPIGQWVYADVPKDKGRFLGVKPSGTVVVAWLGNARNAEDYKAYMRTCRDYARTY